MNGFYGVPAVPDYGYDAMEGALTAFGMVMGVFILFYLALLAFAGICYIFQSLGLYTIAKRRGIRNPWLAWIPVGVVWIIGSISDQYQYVVKGQVRNRRKVLLIGSIVSTVFAFSLGIFNGVSMVLMTTGAAEMFGIYMIVIILLYLLLIAFEIFLMVYTYIAMYDVFASCNPDNATLYLVLSIVIGVVQPFFLFACRKKDLGMPPRREPEPELAPADQPETAEQPEVENCTPVEETAEQAQDAEQPQE